MVEHKCNRCTKIFKQKIDYTRHINRKIPCKITLKTPHKHDNKVGVNTSVQFECSKCHKTFTRNDTLTRHTNRFCTPKNNNSKKKHLCGDILEPSKIDNIDMSCDIIIEESLKYGVLKKIDTPKYSKNPALLHTSQENQVNIKTSQDDNFKCNYCNKTFTRGYSLDRHLDGRCTKRKYIEQQKEEIYKELILQMNELKQKNEEQENKIKTLEQKLSININNTNTNSCNTINSNNTNNINIIAFGQEDLYSLQNSLCKKVLKKGYQCVPALIENTHFNINKPEYHNVYIPNMKDLYAMIFDGKRWGLKEKNDVVNQLFDDKQCFLVDKFHELKDELDQTTLKKFDRFLNNSDDDIYNNLKKDIKLLLYNKRDIPLKTKKIYDENLRKDTIQN